jgi:hypothetical protein
MGRVIGSSLPASAQDETNQDEVMVQAPLDAIDCGNTTISVLGLPIDISKASLINSNSDGKNTKGSGDLTCADLAVDQVVEVKLASDTGLLTAIKVVVGGNDCIDSVCDPTKITGPLQDINSNKTSVTVLGLVVDISSAILEDDNEQPINKDQLIVGQCVDLMLVSNKPPLVATIVQFQNSSIEVDVEEIDEGEKPVEDGDTNDVQVDLAIKRKGKVLRSHTTSNGYFKLVGLPTG